MLFNDAGALTYETISEDVCGDFFKHKHFFDFSNYPEDSNFFYPTIKKVIDKMKEVFERKVSLLN